MPRADVLAAFRSWSTKARRSNPDIVRIGCFGSYARGDYTPASDLDVLVEVSRSNQPRRRDRPDDLPSWSEIPVGVEIFVYTSAEIEDLRTRGSAWLKTVLSEIIWEPDLK